MPTSRLPDINTAFGRHRDGALRMLKEKNFVAVEGELIAFNGLLPEDYRVEMSDTQYAKETTLHFLFYCRTCKKYIKYKDTVQFDAPLTRFEALVQNRAKVKVWRCNTCNHVYKLDSTKTQEQKLGRPSFLKVVPNPPRRDKIFSEYDYARAFVKWAYQMMAELDNQAAQYRDDNWIRESEESAEIAGADEK